MKSFSPVIALLLLSQLCTGAATEWQKAEHIQVRLISMLDTITPDSEFHLGLELKPEEHWHVYWRNPGDSGMPVSIEWELPKVVSASDIIWPIPQKIPFGHLVNYGYEGRVILPVKMTLNGTTPSAKTSQVSLKANTSWLVCKDSCIPGSAVLEMVLKTAAEEIASSDSNQLKGFIHQQAKHIKLMNGKILESGENLEIELFANKPIFKSAKSIVFFPIDESLFSASADTKIKWKNNFLKLSQKKSESFYKLPNAIRGLLVVDNTQAWEFSFKTNP